MAGRTRSDAQPREDAAERLARLIRIPTVSSAQDGSGTAELQRLVQELERNWPLAHAALERERIGEVAWLYRWPGAAAERPLVLAGHLDVVPAAAADGWSFEPFAGLVTEHHVHGRGALDDKGAVSCIFEAVESLLAQGFAPAQDVYLAFCGDEESYGGSAAVVAETLAARGVQPLLVLDEGGGVVDSVFPGVTAPLAMLGVSEKGILSLRLEVEGTPGHASAPPRRPAPARLVRALARLERPVFRARLPALAHRMLAAVAPHAAPPTGWVFRHHRLFAPLLRRALERFGGEPAALLRTTVALTVLEAGEVANTVPAAATAILNVRLAPGATIDGVVAAIRARLGDPGIRLTVLEAHAPSPVSPHGGGSEEDRSAWSLLTGAVARSYPDAVPVPYLQVSSADARFYHERFPRVYRFAPLQLDAEAMRSFHGVDERVLVASLEAGRVFFSTLLTMLR